MERIRLSQSGSLTNPPNVLESPNVCEDTATTGFYFTVRTGVVFYWTLENSTAADQVLHEIRR